MRIFTTVTALCLGLLSVVIPIATQAAVISFDAVTGQAEAIPTNTGFTCGGNPNVDYCKSPLIFSNSGIDITVTASTSITTNEMDLIPWYDISPADLGGIGAATKDEVDNDTGSADNAVTDEFIHVLFSQTVEITGWWLNGNHKSGSDAHLIDMFKNEAGGTAVDYIEANGSFADFSGIADRSIVTGTAFFFYADGPFYLAGIEYEAESVPEPATLVLLALALLSFTAFQQRQSRTAS